MKYTRANTPFTITRQLHMLYRGIRRQYTRWSIDDLTTVSQSMALPETRLPRLLRLTIVTFSGATGLFILWAAVTPVKELVRAEGQVLPSGYNRLVQHPEGGLVHEIMVHEGDFVEKGQVLAELDGAGLEEDYQEQKALVEALAQQSEEARRELDAFRQRRGALPGRQRDGMYAALHKVEADLAQAQETLKKRGNRVDRLEIRSPVTGYVKDLRLNAIGAVVPAGQALMEIMPVDEQRVVEVRILPQQIGRVAPGQEVQVKVDAYGYMRYGTLTGKLESISAIAFSDGMHRQDYYKGRVRLTHNYVGTTPGVHPLLPGMTVNADIVTGEKSVLGYLLKPIQLAMPNAMTEQ